MPTRRADSFSTSLLASALLAAVSVSVAIWLSLQPARLTDLHRVAAWVTEWTHGAPVYGVGSDVDYPPWAIVIFSPLAAIPSAWLPVVWVSINLCALAAIARRLVPDGGVVFFLVLAAGAMRTLNQFSLVLVAFALAGSASSGVMRGLWLGLSLAKPQIGLVFWLQAVWRRQWRLAAEAALVPLVCTIAFSVVAHMPIREVLPAYLRAIALQYGSGLAGQTEITLWLRALVPAVPAAAWAVVVALLVWGTLLRVRPAVNLAMVSLLSVRHLSYDLILLLPGLARLEGWQVWIAALCCVADPSAVLGLLWPSNWLAIHADRLMLLGLWGVLVLSGQSFWGQTGKGYRQIERQDATE